MRRELQEELQTLFHAWDPPAQPFIAPWSVNKDSKLCSLGDGALRESQFAAEVLTTRGIAPDSPEAEDL